MRGAGLPLMRNTLGRRGSVGDSTAIPEGRAEASANPARFRVVAWIAGALCFAFAAAHLYFALTAIPVFEAMYRDMGGPIPPATQALFTLNRWGLLFLILVCVDALVFAGMYWLAKRYWIGLLFAPIPVYIAINYLLIPVLYAPLWQVVEFAK